MTEKTIVFSDWVRKGFDSGWITLYERELLEFLTREYGPLPQSVETAVVFSSLFLRAGHVCLPLDQSPKQWIRQLDIDTRTQKAEDIRNIDIDEILDFPASGTPADNGNQLFILEDKQFYIRRYWYYEKIVAQRLIELTSYSLEIHSVPKAQKILKQLFPENNSDGMNLQKIAAALSIVKKFLLISGGPGTGKTTTVSRILAFILQMADKPLRIALASPTGKAAAHMAQALHDELKDLHLEPELKSSIPDEAKTLHRLLAPTEQRGLLPPAEKKKLPYDLIIIDEASMMDLTLMYRLVINIEKDTRLIMLGDKEQLSSVEAGSILGDICRKQKNQFTSATVTLLKKMGIADPLPTGDQDKLDDCILYLTKNYRFTADSGIAMLAEAIRDSTVDRIEDILYSSDKPDLEYYPFQYSVEGFQLIFNEMLDSLDRCEGKSPEEMLRVWSDSVWLTVLRNGPFGTDALNYMIEENLIRNRKIRPKKGWYTGRPVLVTRNDYTLGVFNGDLGVCTMKPDASPWITFVKKEGETKQIPAYRLQDFEPGYVLTVHKSQGSEFRNVTLLLPHADTPVFTKELLYTAVTRAKKSFKLYGNPEILQLGSERKTVRYTGLGDKI